MVLKESVAVEELPNLFKFYYGSVLVMHGRAPVCLRCRRHGHIRHDCPTPRCTGHRAFGYIKEDCAGTYASIVGESPAVDDSHESNMGTDAAETAAPMLEDDLP
ncbi:hypothetical protein HPB51_012912 [Rhipicephalus microplus]|uniref:CCHC-type domain-containing protein n=1 Tax=Rhipicephalus microplus TaxID=6941 RepID=A0A9J6ETL8_RHIMP|nr:hypothetical protein HPB51_012912 [Rhipicephalus microplus]